MARFGQTLLTLLLASTFPLTDAHGSGKYVNLDGSVVLTANQSCPDGQTQNLIYMGKADASSRAVAKRVSGMWEPEEDYKDRIDNSASSVNLTRVNVNDGGLYEFTCGTESDPKYDTRVQVTVVIPFDISVTEGEKVKLPCYPVTAGQTVKRVRWERDEELVLELDLSSGETKYGTKFDRRDMSVSPDYSKGDMSLIVKAVQVEDRGQFTCYIDGDRTRGKPDGVRMKVNMRHHVTCTSPIVVGLSIVAGEVVCLVVGVIMWCRCRKSCRPNVTSGPGGRGGPSAENVEIMKGGNKPVTC